MNLSKWKFLKLSVTVLVALIILADFVLPGKTFEQEVLEIEKTKQQYYNPAGGSHYSYGLVTARHYLSVSEEFAASITNEKIFYRVSLIFKRINSYQLTTSNHRETYSFRWISGLIIPLLIIMEMLFAFIFEKRNTTLLFILQIILFANLALLLYGLFN